VILKLVPKAGHGAWRTLEKIVKMRDKGSRTQKFYAAFGAVFRKSFKEASRDFLIFPLSEDRLKIYGSTDLIL
jgi:hypothetical protein